MRRVAIYDCYRRTLRSRQSLCFDLQDSQRRLLLSWAPVIVTSHSKRIPYLDGVRGVAVLLVFVAHLLQGVYPIDKPLFSFLPSGGGGGFIGVQIFFVLSGYLITNILVRDHEAHGHIRYFPFYMRRFFRLFPALFFACMGYLIYVLLAQPHTTLPGALGATFRALTYTTNLEFLYHRVPDTRWLHHTWSLAVEEQFYLLWPLVLSLLFGMTRKSRLGLVVIGIILAFVLRLVPRLAPIGYDIIRWDALLVGCFLALSKLDIPWRVTWIGLPIIAYYTVHLASPIASIDYLIGAIGGGLFLCYAAHAKWLTWNWLRYLGHISYSLYLWHILVMRVGLPGYASVALSFLFADLSRRLIEVPLQNWGVSLLERRQAQRLDANLSLAS